MALFSESCGESCSLPAWQPAAPRPGKLVLRLGLEESAGRLGLGLQTRAALTGLRPGEAAQLLAAGAGDKVGAGAWRLHLQPGLRVACISAEGAWEAQLATAVAAAPHVLLVEAAALRGKEPRWPALLGFQGGLLLLEAERGAAADERELCALGVTSRWRRGPCGLVSEPLQAWLHEVEVGAMEEALHEQLAPLYMQEYSADLENLAMAQRDYGLKVSLLLQPRPAGPELLGFVAFKVWGGRRKGASLAALAVAERHRGRGLGRRLMGLVEAAATEVAGRVYCKALPTAVPFCVRLGYQPYEACEDGAVAVALSRAAPHLYVDGEIDEDSACVAMMSRRPGAPGQASAEAWCPKVSQHLEDGPHWVPKSQLLA